MRHVLVTTIIAVTLSTTLAPGAAAPPATTAPREAQHLFYSASWNAIPVARAELTIQPAPAGDATVQLAGHAETMPLLDLLWRMRDSFEATVATTPPAPRRFMLRQQENRRRRETSVVRDEGGQRLLGNKQRPGKRVRSATTALHARLHDPASLAYLLRSLPANLERPQTFDVFTGTKTFRLTARAAGEETIAAVGRQWQARRLALTLALAPIDEGAPTAEVPKVQTADVWISTDTERLPLRLSGRTYWGWVTVQLVARRPPRSATAS